MSKCTVKKIKRQSTKWRKMFATHIFDKSFISRRPTFFLQNNKTEKIKSKGLNNFSKVDM